MPNSFGDRSMIFFNSDFKWFIWLIFELSFNLFLQKTKVMKEVLLNVFFVIDSLKLPRKSWKHRSSVLIATTMCFLIFPRQYVNLGERNSLQVSQGMAIQVSLFQQRLGSIYLIAIHLRRLHFVDLNLGLSVSITFRVSTE